MRNLLILFFALILCGCATAQKDKWNPELVREKRGLLGKKEIVIGGWVPKERYRCTGVGCKATFETGGSIEGGKVIDNVKLDN